ncbi:TetR/AcrR family transcriptional regulator [Nocardia africana]|uniref:TetR/AcrR family transcriptional regulator n=1 Tax=Nocardia africana TaxID=134964 RepID=A0ABW6NNS9_9NOCA
MRSSRPTSAPAHRRPRGRRAEIVAAAVAAFARDGYHGTSMAGIAAEVGISSAALYRHFRSKQDLLGHCLRDGLDTTLARVNAADTGADTAGRHVLFELVRVAVELRGLPRLWQVEFRNLTPADRQAVLVRAVRLIHRIRGAIRPCRPDLAEADVELLAWCILSVVVSPSYHRVDLPQAVFAELLDTAVAAVVATDLPRRDAAPQRRAPQRISVTEDEEFERELRPERMIVAAARLFNTRGFAAVGIEDIGAAVGVSGPALYHHFDSKAALLDEIIDRNDQWIRLYTSRALATSSNPRQALTTLLTYFARFAIDEPDLLGTTVSEVDHLPAESATRYRRAHREGILRWARMLQTARPQLSLPTARVLIQAVSIMVIDAARNPRLSRRGDIVPALVAIGDSIAFTTSRTV